MMSRYARASSGDSAVMDFVSTPVGTAGLTWYPAHGSARAVALLGHGTATGVEAPDLQALAAALPRQGITVALVTQPYRLRRRRAGSTGRPSMRRGVRCGRWPRLQVCR